MGIELYAGPNGTAEQVPVCSYVMYVYVGDDFSMDVFSGRNIKMSIFPHELTTHIACKNK